MLKKYFTGSIKCVSRQLELSTYRTTCSSSKYGKVILSLLLCMFPSIATVFGTSVTKHGNHAQWHTKSPPTSSYLKLSIFEPLDPVKILWVSDLCGSHFFHRFSPLEAQVDCVCLLFPPQAIPIFPEEAIGSPFQVHPELITLFLVLELSQQQPKCQ